MGAGTEGLIWFRKKAGEFAICIQCGVLLRFDSALLLTVPGQVDFEQALRDDPRALLAVQTLVRNRKQVRREPLE